MAYTLSSSLLSVPTGGAVTRDAGGRVYIDDTITLETGAVVDVDLTCVGFIVPTGQTVTFGRTAPDGTEVPVSIVMTRINYSFTDSPFRIEGNPTINVKNTTFHMRNGANMWGSWPGAINTDGSTLNATNMRLVSYTGLTSRQVNPSSEVQIWIPGNGVINGLEVTGIDGLFFNASPTSTENIKQLDAVAARGISVASSGTDPVNLIGVSAERVNVQQQPCFLQITNLSLSTGYNRVAATANTSRFAIRKSIDGTLVGASSNTKIVVWDTTAQQSVYSRIIGTNSFDPLVDSWRVYENNSTTATAAQIEAGTGAETGSYVPFVRIAVLDYGRALSTTGYTLSIRQADDNLPVDITQVLANDTSLTETTKATVDAYTTLETPQKFYDYAKSYLVDNYAGEAATIVSRSGNEIDAGSYNVTIDATAASVFAFDGSTITIKASTYTGDMTTTGIITLANGATFIGTRTDANGTVAPPKVATISGITAGSRLQIYNVTTDTEVVNAVVAGTSYTATYEEGTGYNEGDSVRIRLVYVNGATAKLPYTAGAVVGATGWSVLAAQQDDTVYNTIGVDGSTITEFAADYPNVQVDTSDPDGETRVDRLYSWFVYTQSTEDGIANWFGGIEADDIANFKIVTSILDLKIDNTSATGVTFVDGKRLYRDDDASPLVASTSGGGSITLFAGKVFTSVVSTASPVITGDIDDVPARVQSGLTSQGYTTARATRIDSLSTTSNVATIDNLRVVNDGVKKASLLIPHTEDL